jgi:uncharacterized membrane protein
VPFPHHVALFRTCVALAADAGAIAISRAAGAGWGVAVTIGWVAGAAVILTWIWTMIGPMDAVETAAHAKAEDFSRPVADIVLLSASVASLIAIGFTLYEARSAHGFDKVRLVGLTIAAVALAWATVHTIYTLRYGDLYYDSPPAGGIDFGGDAPDYRDFAYVAFTIGMTFQVSDTNLESKPIRRAATRHALLSYLFGAVIVAVAINTFASILLG